MQKKIKWMFAVLFLFSAIMAWGQEEGEQFSVATLNVDGLPQKILVLKVNPDGPGDAGTARIGKYLLQKKYDLMMLQEDFNFHDVLTVFLEDDYKFDTWSGNVGTDGHKIDFLHLQNHRFECDGLLACWRNDLTVTPSVRTAWKQNFGKFSHANDEMVTKGFRCYEVTLRGGTRIVVFNMHMDASDDADEVAKNDSKDKEARMAQWQQLKEEVLQQLDTRPILIMGDMNSLYGRDNVKGEFIDAINASGRGTIADVWVEMEQHGTYPDDQAKGVADGETLDKILYINPVEGTKIQPVAFSIDRDGYLYNGKPLGDHYPVAATFKVVSNIDAIEEVENNQSGDYPLYYNLNGQRISQPRRGMYIRQSAGKTDKHIVK